MNGLRRCATAIGCAVVQCVAAAAPSAPDEASDPAALRRGEQVYTRCAACHAINTHRTGPQHCGVFGRRAGTAPGFEGYSKAMRASKIVWNERTLDAFLESPMQAVPGTAMGYAGVKDGRERADLIAWLRQASSPWRGCKVSR